MLGEGERYGRYELVRYLAAGGMADLYLAHREDLPEPLVIKKIQTRYVEFSRVVKMFIDEGRIAQALEHPNIVKVVDVGHEQGTYYIAMEYIPGRDLLAICRRGVEVQSFIPRHLAIAVLVQALRGLQHAHEKLGPEGRPLKVVHCDISPGNIVVSWGGTAKIVDFGIARATIQLRAEDHTVAGKYSYMAPEQIRGEPVDARADIFSIGVILYELTVGKRLFRGAAHEVMHRVLEEPIPRPRDVRPGFPPALEEIILRALARDREQRYPSARLLREDLKRFLLAEQRPAGKREIAEYLKAIFEAEKRMESEEFTSDVDQDDELLLERALPGAGTLPFTVDPDDPPDDASGMLRIPPGSREGARRTPPTGSAALAAEPVPAEAVVGERPAPSPAAPAPVAPFGERSEAPVTTNAPARVEARVPAGGPRAARLIGAVCAAGVGLLAVLYFLFRG